MKVCHIIGALPYKFSMILSENDIVIAADAGYKTLQSMGITPDLIVGDFDSLGECPKGDNVIRHPVMKDDTDVMLAVKLGLERGCDVFMIYGGLGGRQDHTIANIQTLAYIAGHGGRGFLIGENETVTVIGKGECLFGAENKGIISVFAYGGEAKNVTLSGFLYKLEKALLTPSFPLGVSNEFTGRPAKISVEEGMLMIIWTGIPQIP